MRKIIMCLSLVLFVLSSQAQKEYGGHPMLVDQLKTQSNKLKTIEIKPLNSNDILAFNQKSKGIPRFAAPIKQKIDFVKQASIQKYGQNEVKQLSIKLANAKGIILKFEQFEISQGSRLFFYDSYGKQIQGAYTSDNNRPSKKFITQLLLGDEIIIELYEANPDNASNVIIDAIYQITDLDEATNNDHPFQVKEMPMDTGFLASFECNINVNCPLGDDWQDEKRGIIRIMMVLEEGLGWCSGSLINNTANDGRAFLLTAFHCQYSYTPEYDLWRFDFNYEAEACADPTEEPDKTSLLGCDLRAGREESDFLLLELQDHVPQSVNAFFNGWNRHTSALPSNGTIIHHPAGDIKKISYDQNTVSVHPSPIGWSNGVITPANFHFKSILEEGTMQGGSSGCPLLDQDGRIVGQLHGGNANCTNFLTYHGRFSKSWDEAPDAAENLEFWLDPDNTGEITIDGIENPAPETVEISGYVEDPNGVAMPNVNVTLGGDTSLTTITDINGFFQFLNVATSNSYDVSASKDINDANGISALDLVQIQKHILGLVPFDNPFKEMAADANNSGGASGADLVDITKVNLALIPNFPNQTSWIFFPGTVFINDVNSDRNGLLFTGIKIGDVNFSADPSN